MGNVIPWSQIHPSITSQEPFVAVVIIDPERQICVSEMVPFDQEALASPDVSASEVIAAAQAPAATGRGVRSPPCRPSRASGQVKNRARQRWPCQSSWQLNILKARSIQLACGS